MYHKCKYQINIMYKCTHMHSHLHADMQTRNHAHITLKKYLKKY